MKRNRKNREIDLDQLISAVRGEEIEPARVEQSANRVWQRMQATAADEVPVTEIIRGCADVRNLLAAYKLRSLTPARSLLVEDHLRECVACRQHAYGLNDAEQTTATWAPAQPTHWSWKLWPMPKLAFAAAMVIVVIAAGWFINQRLSAPAGPRARVQAVEGTVTLVSMQGERRLKVADELQDWDLIRTGAGGHAFVKLLDGSVVEMNQRAEFSVSAGRKDTTIHLDRGSIIVQAAKRHSGHLYVAARDCRVAVTGTVFSVNSGVKGSRVAVVEGEVHVDQGEQETVLHAGDEIATSASISYVPVQQEIAWSKNLEQHLALLAEFSRLEKKIEQIPSPQPRYQSRILPLLPNNTVFYLSVPNLGEMLSEANQIFQQQLQQSPVLQQWWVEANRGNKGPSLDELIQKIRDVSQYLGDEIVVSATSDQGRDSGPVILAEVRREGLKDFMKNEFQTWRTSASRGFNPLVVDETELHSLPAAARGSYDFVVLVLPGMMVMTDTVAAAQRIDSQLTSGASGFGDSDFGRHIVSAYNRGAGLVLAADLQGMSESKAHPQNSPNVERDRLAMQASGFSDLKYLIVEKRDVNGQPDNRAVIEFNGPRRGIASWLAPPAPMGSLDFVSSDASLVVASVAKSPAQMLDDLLNVITTANPRAQGELAKFEARTNIRLRDDLAASLGGDATIAIDGPVLPKPSWKLVAEVYDPSRLQYSIEHLLAAVNDEARQHGRPGATMNQEQLGGRTFYAIHFSNRLGVTSEVDYTFSDGYLIMAPSRALVISALRTHDNGMSLARSTSFQSILPRDQHANFSALVYQNLTPVLGSLVSQLSPQIAQSVQALAADSKPTVICAYGESDRIEIASTSRFFGFDLNSLTLSSLLSQSKTGTQRGRVP